MTTVAGNRGGAGYMPDDENWFEDEIDPAALFDEPDCVDDGEDE